MKISPQAPWTDYQGKPIFEGDILRHPTGETGRVVIVSGEEESDRWRVDYGDKYTSALCLQIGDKGMANVITEQLTG